MSRRRSAKVDASRGPGSHPGAVATAPPFLPVPECLVTLPPLLLKPFPPLAFCLLGPPVPSEAPLLVLLGPPALP